MRVYRAFQDQVVRHLDPDGWELAQGEVHAWIARFLAADPACDACGRTEPSDARCICAWRKAWR